MKTYDNFNEMYIAKTNQNHQKSTKKATSIQNKNYVWKKNEIYVDDTRTSPYCEITFYSTSIFIRRDRISSGKRKYASFRQLEPIVTDWCKRISIVHDKDERPKITFLSDDAINIKGDFTEEEVKDLAETIDRSIHAGSQDGNESIWKPRW